eukprot:jgi/Botrbrau1/18684/Bobra.0386s0012.1
MLQAWCHGNCVHAKFGVTRTAVHSELVHGKAESVPVQWLSCVSDSDLGKRTVYVTYRSPFLWGCSNSGMPSPFSFCTWPGMVTPVAASVTLCPSK